MLYSPDSGLPGGNFPNGLQEFTLYADPTTEQIFHSLSLGQG